MALTKFKMNCAYIIFCVHLPMFLFAEKTYKAAVFEPTISTRTAMGNPNRTAAVNRLKTVLTEYAEVAAKAHKENVDILVFPENGLIADLTNYTRDNITSFLDTIPEPNKESPWIPCNKPNSYTRTEIQEVISCIAKKNKIYLVVNLGDLQTCKHTEDSNCPADGRYQYNTNVVYSSDGALVSKYHKKHLFYEPYYDTPKIAEHAVFDTPFGRFASIVCFDIYYKDTLKDLIEKYQVSNILFPNLWFDISPFFLSALFHNSIAKAYNINLVSANIRINNIQPYSVPGGSGIYTPSYNHYRYKPFSSTPSDGYISLQVNNSEEGQTCFPNPPIRSVPKSDNPVVEITNMSSLFPVSAVILQNKSGIVSVCKFGACCSLEYEFLSNRTSTFKINYILAISNKENVNLTNEEGVEMQSCLLCPIHAETISCLMTLPKDIPIGDVSFNKLKMTTHNFSTPYFFPHIATFNSVNSFDINRSWKHFRGQIENTKTIEKLFTAIIFGRLYPEISSSSTVISAPLLILLNLLSKQFFI